MQKIEENKTNKKTAPHCHFQEMGFLKPGEQHCLQSDSQPAAAAAPAQFNRLTTHGLTATLKIIIKVNHRN